MGLEPEKAEVTEDLQSNPAQERLILGLAGRRGSGKGTCADILRRHRQAHVLAFADPIKWQLAALFNVPLKVFTDPALKDAPLAEAYGHTPRYLMQSYGTGWGTSMVNKRIWVDLLLRRLPPTGLAVVEDVRFPSEAQALRELGGVIAWVHRNRGRPKRSEADKHISENELSIEDSDYVLLNGGTEEGLEALEEDVLRLVDTVVNPQPGALK